MPSPSKHSQADLILLKVVEPFPHDRAMPPAEPERIRQRTRAWAHEYLERLAADVQQQGQAVQKTAMDGHPHTGVAEYAETSLVDLMAMSKCGSSGLSRWLMGSVADGMARGTNVPLLLPREQWEEAERFGGNATKIHSDANTLITSLSE